ncbi:MAG TPA: hypothetical protein PKJ13_07985 [bacterium]|nr:hypothetical protein [bacterium]HOH06173.1 hypothetical protein [bacterium]HOY43206.1 hypothetical protein [bacterium]HPG83854.1 hypothetical protein [bacterium]HPM59636.1 hypothetical protein [bacterium]
MNKLTPTSMVRWLVIAAALLLVLLLPFRIPYTIKTIAKVQPRREWLVVRAEDGQISTHLWNHQSATLERVTVTQMLRGDATEFQILPGVLGSAEVAEGDTIAILHSADLVQAIAALQGDLTAARGSLLALSTGEKLPMIEEAQHQIEHAVVMAQEQKRVAERLAELHARQLVPFQEYELALATQQAFEANIAVARSRLASIQTGAKKEEIAAMEAQIAALEKELAALQQKAEGYLLRSPLSGTRIQHFASDTLLAVAETGSCILTMPVRARDRSLLIGGEEVTIRASESRISGKGSVVFINPMLELLNGEQVFWVVARLEQPTGLISGLFVPCELKCKSLSKWQYLQRFME